jgi:nucleoside-diphosphate-sugar epimerase
MLFATCGLYEQECAIMKVLFIGGTGNISTAVSHAALARGIELWHVNRGQREAVPGVQTIVADIRAAEAAGALAAHTWDVVVDWIAYTVEDVARDIALFRGRTRQFVFISTASAYHKPPRQPLITEATPLHNPFWDYSQRKIACEAQLMAAYSTTGFPVTIVRPSHTYAMALPVAIGGSSDYAVIERMLRGQEVVVHGDGTSLWTVTHADDFARGFVGLLGNPQAIGEAFHITADTPLTWNEIYATLGAAAGVTPRIVHVPTDFIIGVEPALRGPLLGDKAHSTLFDNSKIRRMVPDFVARVPLHHGARRALQWFHADPRRQITRPETHAMFDRVITAYKGHRT